MTTFNMEEDRCHQIVDFEGFQAEDLRVLRFDTIEGWSPGANDSHRFERGHMASYLKL
jgi:hypothetical protein